MSWPKPQKGQTIRFPILEVGPWAFPKTAKDGPKLSWQLPRLDKPFSFHAECLRAQPAEQLKAFARSVWGEPQPYAEGISRKTAVETQGSPKTWMAKQIQDYKVGHDGRTTVGPGRTGFFENLWQFGSLICSMISGEIVVPCYAPYFLGRASEDQSLQCWTEKQSLSFCILSVGWTNWIRRSRESDTLIRVRRPTPAVALAMFLPSM